MLKDKIKKIDKKNNPKQPKLACQTRDPSCGIRITLYKAYKNNNNVIFSAIQIQKNKIK
jgi:hypothetical protein